MKKFLCLSALIVGFLGGIGWGNYRATHPGFPPLPDAHRTIGIITPEGTSSISREWRKGIPRVGSNSHTPRVWMFSQRLDVSAATEYSDSWDASAARHSHPNSTLIHRVFDYYSDLLYQQVTREGFGWGHSSLHNRSYISGAYYSVPERSVYKIDVWLNGFQDSVVVRIMFVPDVLCAEWTAEPADEP